MRALLFRKILAGCLVIAGLTCSVYARQEQTSPGQAPPPTPTPGPTPQPQPRQPNVSPSPQPVPGQSDQITIRGRLITGANSFDGVPVEVRFETDGGQPVGFAYTGSGGEFTFQQASFNLDQGLYAVVKMDGFKLYRERVFSAFGLGEGFLNIFLEPETTTTAANRGAAVVDLKQLRAKIPGKAVDEYEKALKESSRGNRGKAVEGLQRAIKLAPDFYEAQHSLGIQYLAMQQFNDAETALTRARDLSPKAAEPLINLGMLEYQRGEAQSDGGHAEEADALFNKAADFLEEAIRRNPLSPLAHGYLGAALYKLDEFEQAEKTLNRAIELDPEQTDARLMLINVYTKSARYADALEQIKTFFAKNPKSPQRPALENIKQQIEKALALPKN